MPGVSKKSLEKITLDFSLAMDLNIDPTPRELYKYMGWILYFEKTAIYGGVLYFENTRAGGWATGLHVRVRLPLRTGLSRGRRGAGGGGASRVKNVYELPEVNNGPKFVKIVQWWPHSECGL